MSALDSNDPLTNEQALHALRVVQKTLATNFQKHYTPESLTHTAEELNAEPVIRPRLQYYKDELKNKDWGGSQLQLHHTIEVAALPVGHGLKTLKFVDAMWTRLKKGVFCAGYTLLDGTKIPCTEVFDQNALQELLKRPLIEDDEPLEEDAPRTKKKLLTTEQTAFKALFKLFQFDHTSV
jgi:hypothetical protein